MNVDVAINVYGKPYNTAVTLLSLLKHSGQHINKIYFIEELKQPENSDFTFLLDLLKEKIIHYKPKYWFWTEQIKPDKLKDPEYRYGVRYQYAWENSDKNYLFLTHNDVLYTGDIVGAFLENMEDHIGIGSVGQCWNCPASDAKLCNGDEYLSYKPSYKEFEALLKNYNAPRKKDYKNFVNKKNPWPLPECRLNEWVAMINLKVAREITYPKGDAIPFGVYGLDLATLWFRDVLQKGYTVKNYNFNNLAHHAWTTTTGNGHGALFNKDLYQDSESIAKQKLAEEFVLKFG